MADIPLDMFRSYIRDILGRPEFPDTATITRRMGKPNTTISRPMTENYKGKAVRADTVKAVREATGVPYPPALARLMGENGEPPRETSALQLGMMILERLTPRLRDQDASSKAATLKDILDTLEDAARK